MLVPLYVASKPLLARNLKAAREKAGLTQEEAASKSGFSKQAISGWERGAYTPTEPNLQTVADLYGTTPGDLRYSNATEDDIQANVGPPQEWPTPRVALGIPQRIRVWVQEFLLELTKAGVTQEEVDRVRLILSADEMYRFYAGGEPKEYSEDETLEGIQAHAEAFRREFRRRGFNIPK